MPRSRGWVCERCGAQFEARDEYKAHKLEHMHGNIPDKSVSELMGVEPPEPLAQADDQPIVADPNIDYSGADGKNPPPATPIPPAAKELLDQAKAQWNQIPDKDKKKQGTKLVYHFEGWCNKCAGEVETLTIDGVVEDQKKQVVIAWCPACKKQLKQRTVIKL